MTQILNKKRVCAFLGIAGGAILFFLPPPQGLDTVAMRALAILFWAVLWWVSGIIPEYITAMVMGAAFTLCCDLPVATAFSAFAGQTWWLLLAALGLGACIAASGLLTRMALAVIRVCPKSFAGLVSGLLVISIAAAPFIPSLTSKATLFSPLIRRISDVMGYEPGGKAANGLFLAGFTGCRSMAPMVLTASVLGYVLLGLYPGEVQAEFTFLHWLLCALPWWIVTFCLNAAAILLLFGRRSKAMAADPEKLRQRVASPGKMAGRERLVLLVMLVTIALWATQNWHHIPAYAVALLAFCVLLAGGVIDRRQFRSEIRWDFLVFLGVVMGVASVFEEVGINGWLVEMISPYLLAVAANPYAFLLLLALIATALRFAITSEIALVVIILPFLVPMAALFQMNPWVIGMALYAVGNPWILPYQNSTYLTAYAASDAMADQRIMSRYACLYQAICTMALLAAIPVWQMIGLIW